MVVLRDPDRRRPVRSTRIPVRALISAVRPEPESPTAIRSCQLGAIVLPTYSRWSARATGAGSPARAGSSPMRAPGAGAVPPAPTSARRTARPARAHAEPMTNSVLIYAPPDAFPSRAVTRRAGTSRTTPGTSCPRTGCCSRGWPVRRPAPSTWRPGRPRRLAGSPTAIGRPWSVSPTISAGARSLPGRRRASRAGRFDHRLHDDRQRGLQPEHAGAGGGELAALVLLGVRGMVGGDAVDDALGECLPQRGVVGASRSGGFTLLHRVVGLQPRVVEQQVVRGDLGADRDPEPFAQRISSTVPAVEA